MPTLDWIGKDAVIDHHRRVPFHLLQDVPDLAVGDPASDNLIVEGDNLKALKALLPYYAGQVKCIYIDPPYNTGNEGWAYNDNVNSPEMRAWLGAVVGKEAEDLSRHDKWLCMMYPRLSLLREMLAEDGSIWISLDDNEVHHARSMLDELFGANNFVASVIWQKRTSRENRAAIGTSHDYVLVYSPVGALRWKENRNLLPPTDEGFSNPDNDPRGPWKSIPFSAQGYRPNQMYPINTPTGKALSPPEGRCWGATESVFNDYLEKGRVYFPKGGDGRPRIKMYPNESEGLVPTTLWLADEAGTTEWAKKEFMEVLPEADSSLITPKPTRLIQRIVQVATSPDDIVMDAFAGSGTTAHAVLKQNAKDGGRRRFVLVEMEENVARPVTAERVRRAVEGYPYKGTDKTELYRQKLTWTQFNKAEKHLAAIEKLEGEHANRFDTFKREVKNDTLTLYGVKKVKKRREGLGGGFRFAKLGPQVFGESGRVNPEIGYEDLARFVFFLATGRPLPSEPAEVPFLGSASGVGVYLLYNGVLKDESEYGGNVLTRGLLDSLPGFDGPRVVYGAASRVAPERLDALGVTFRQIPYQLRVEA